MKMIVVGVLAALGLAIAAPAGAAVIATPSAIIASQSNLSVTLVRGPHGNRGRHLGWTRGRHYGWARGRGRGRY